MEKGGRNGVKANKERLKKWNRIIPRILIFSTIVFMYSSEIGLAESNNGKAGSLADIEFYTEKQERKPTKEDKIILPQAGSKNEGHLTIAGGILLIAVIFFKRNDWRQSGD